MTSRSAALAMREAVLLALHIRKGFAEDNLQYFAAGSTNLAGRRETEAFITLKTLTDAIAAITALPLPDEPAAGTDSPAAWVIPGDDNANDRGFIDAMAWREGEFTRPLYERPDPFAALPPAAVDVMGLLEAYEDHLRNQLRNMPGAEYRALSGARAALIAAIAALQRGARSEL